MLNRLLAGNDATQAPVADTLAHISKLLESPLGEERHTFILHHLCDHLAGDVRGYTVYGNESTGYQLNGLSGYDENFRQLAPQFGPFTEARARIISSRVSALYIENSDEVRNDLVTLGVTKAKSTLVIPFRDESATVLVLHKHSTPAFSRDDLSVVTEWINAEQHIASLHQERQLARLSLFEFARAFVEAAEAQDFSQLGHAARVTSYAMELGRAAELDSDQQNDLYLASMLHDIGKLGSSNWREEDEVHPQRGANLLAGSPLLLSATSGIRSHHERWDGTGYPDRLASEHIPLLGRIIAIADTFDKLSSERGQALPLHEVEKEILARSGKELDPELVDTFIKVLRQGKTTQEIKKIAKSLFL